MDEQQKNESATPGDASGNSGRAATAAKSLESQQQSATTDPDAGDTANVRETRDKPTAQPSQGEETLGIP